jgi:hypothetical protein
MAKLRTSIFAIYNQPCGKIRLLPTLANTYPTYPLSNPLFPHNRVLLVNPCSDRGCHQPWEENRLNLANNLSKFQPDLIDRFVVDWMLFHEMPDLVQIFLDEVL